MPKLDTRARHKSHPGMPDARATILKRLEDIGWTRWYFATQCEKRNIGAATVMQFLKGTSDTKIDKLNIMLDVIGMKVEYVVTGEPKEQ